MSRKGFQQTLAILRATAATTHASKASIEKYAALAGSVIGLYTLVKAVANLRSNTALDKHFLDEADRLAAIDAAAAAAHAVDADVGERGNLGQSDNSNTHEICTQDPPSSSISQPEYYVPEPQLELDASLPVSSGDDEYADIIPPPTKSNKLNRRPTRSSHRVKRLIVYLKPSAQPSHRHCCIPPPVTTTTAPPPPQTLSHRHNAIEKPFPEALESDPSLASILKTARFEPSTPTHFSNTNNIKTTTTKDSTALMFAFSVITLLVFVLGMLAYAGLQNRIAYQAWNTSFEENMKMLAGIASTSSATARSLESNVEDASLWCVMGCLKAYGISADSIPV
ncbi:hypothetical protein BJ741DRAFT_624544 [Chytriomyces cf. hyalinus JEL632]|nr:hypothetical protein BJ741DRAFT_624544 [Chytriomyces cf. hyalinus JEL632]